jgi:AraC-like DNA-binding protein
MAQSTENSAAFRDKMKRALALLQQRDKKISTIAKELGYTSGSHFSNAFKRFYGTTPSTLRTPAKQEKTFEEKLKWLGAREVNRLKHEWNNTK